MPHRGGPTVVKAWSADPLWVDGRRPAADDPSEVWRGTNRRHPGISSAWRPGAAILTQMTERLSPTVTAMGREFPTRQAPPPRPSLWAQARPGESGSSQPSRTDRPIRQTDASRHKRPEGDPRTPLPQPWRPLADLRGVDAPPSGSRRSRDLDQLVDEIPPCVHVGTTNRTSSDSKKLRTLSCRSARPPSPKNRKEKSQLGSGSRAHGSLLQRLRRGGRAGGDDEGGLRHLGGCAGLV